MRRQGRSHAATAGPDDQHVDDVIEAVHLRAGHVGIAVLIAKPAINSSAGL